MFATHGFSCLATDRLAALRAALILLFRSCATSRLLHDASKRHWSRANARRAAIAGGLVATYFPFQPYVGLEFVIVMYAGVVLGGIGSIIGAFWGGMIIGLVQQMSTLILPHQLQNTAIFVVFLLVIFFRPQGLFGKNVERA